MILVYTAPELFMVAHVRNLLELEGIACALRNEYSSAAVGRIPFNECWPELWVEDEQAVRARALVAEAFASGGPGGESWCCGSCGEVVEDTFAQCWKCGAMRPAGG